MLDSVTPKMKRYGVNDSDSFSDWLPNRRHRASATLWNISLTETLLTTSSTLFSVGLCLSIRLTQAAIASKRLNLRWCKVQKLHRTLYCFWSSRKISQKWNGVIANGGTKLQVWYIDLWIVFCLEAMQIGIKIPWKANTSLRHVLNGAMNL